MPNFDYDSLIAIVNDQEALKRIYSETNNNYAKLNIFRIIKEGELDGVHSVLRKFINESFHVENELISQLDPNEYDLIPDYIIEECNQCLLNNKS